MRCILRWFEAQPKITREPTCTRGFISITRSIPHAFICFIPLLFKTHYVVSTFSVFGTNRDSLTLAES